MKIEKYLAILKHPGAETEADFVISGNHVVDEKSNQKYAIRHHMIDFQGTFDNSLQKPEKKAMFKLNTFYSHHVDPWILRTIFAGGGGGFIKADRKLKQWIDQYMENTNVLFVEPENKRHLTYVPAENCLSVKDYDNKNVEPLPEDYPDLNASPEQLPIRSSSFESIISNFVLEHIKNPRRHIGEISRVIKPGGYAIITGPGDVYPSHKVPYNYFNVIRYGYHEMFTENNLVLEEEYFPSRSWMSILYLAYITTVRNSWFNKNQLTKLIQMIVFSISVLISPLFNVLAYLLDLVTPFDKRVYGIYMALVRKPVTKH